MQNEPNEGMDPESNASLPLTSTENTCIACAEPIDPAASVCPFCTTHQTHRRRKHVEASLKWAGGIAAVIGIVTTTIQLNKLVQPALEKQSVVKQILKAAEKQSFAGSHESATALIDEALNLNAASLQARKGRIHIAMEQIRQILWVAEEEKQTLDRLLPDLYLGAGFEQVDKKLAADAYAHLGWLNYLRQNRIGSIDIVGFFEKALDLYPDNVFARVFWAHVCPEVCADRIAHAVDHLEAARKEAARKVAWKRGKANRELRFVHSRMHYLLCERNLDLAWPHCFAFLDQVKETAFWSAQRKRQTFERLQRLFRDERRFSDMKGVASDIAFSPIVERLRKDPDLQELFDSEDHPNSQVLWEARVKDFNGESDVAKRHYRSLRTKVKTRHARIHTRWDGILHSSLDIALARLIGVHLGTLGLTWDKFAGTEALGLGKRWAQQVQTVDHNGPAAKAGIKPGDIVLAVNGEAITSEGGRFVLETLLAGETVELLVWRRDTGKARYPVILGKQPFNEEKIEQLIDKSLRELWYLDVAIDKVLYGDTFTPVVEEGFSVTDLTEVVRREFSIPTEIKGALILNNRIPNRSFGTGDVILEINGVAIGDTAGFLERFRAIRTAGEKLFFTRYREGVRKTLTL